MMDTEILDPLHGQLLDSAHVVTSPPAGAVGMMYARTRVGGRIAAKQGVPYSHAVISLGNTRTIDAAWPRVRIRRMAEWRRDGDLFDWWAWKEPLTSWETDRLVALAEILNGRIRYDWPALLRLALGRYSLSDRAPDRMYCTHLVAELLLAINGCDISGVMQPWNVTPRSLLQGLRWGPFVPLHEPLQEGVLRMPGPLQDAEGLAWLLDLPDVRPWGDRPEPSADRGE